MAELINSDSNLSYLVNKASAGRTFATTATAETTTISMSNHSKDLPSELKKELKPLNIDT